MLVLLFFCLTAGVFAQTSTSSNSRASSSASVSSCAFSSTSGSSSTTSCTKLPPLTDGPCPNISSDTIDFNRLIGEWYEVQRSANIYDGVDECQKILWGKSVNNVSQVISKSSSYSGSLTSSTIAHVVQTEQGIHFSYRLPTMGNVPKEYFALYLDYMNFAISWACKNKGNGHIETAWVFSRKPTQPRNIETSIQNTFARYNLTVPKMVKLNLVDCCRVFSSFDFCS